MNSLISPQQNIDQTQQYHDRLSKISMGVAKKGIQIPILQAYQSKYVILQESLKIKQQEEKENYKQQEEKENQRINQQQYQPIIYDLIQKEPELYIDKPYQEKPQQEQEDQNSDEEQLIIYGVIEQSKKNKNVSKDFMSHQKDFKSLKKELLQMQIQVEAKKPKSVKTSLCRNAKIISKLSGSLLSVYNVYFREIADSFIDDILLDEIQYLNQNEYKQERDQSAQKILDQIKPQDHDKKENIIQSPQDENEFKESLLELVQKLNQIVVE